jgi:DNA (cytosine-5)-methyltransferase 1
MKNKKDSYTFIDLFADCGGLTEGFSRQGFKTLTHVEFDHFACEYLRTRIKFYGYPENKIK